MSKEKRIKKTGDRENEKGAALVMALLVTFLLLVASAGLLLESSLNSQNVTDATTEQQAYNAAESGIQSAINVLRGNVAPSPLLDTTKPATDPANKVSYVKALKLTSSNLSGDTSTTPRLSRWLSYNGTCNDRVTMGAASCSGADSFSYAVSLSDPDNTGSYVSYTTTGVLFDNDGSDTTQKTYGSGANKIIVKYYPATISDLNVAAGAANTNFGYFQVTSTGTGAAISSFNRFQITMRMTRPYAATRVIRGFIETNSAGAVPKIVFDAQTFSLLGCVMSLNFGWGSPTPVASPPQRYGYEAQLSGSSTGTNNNITGTITSPEPTRLLLTSTGYGPRGSTKRLEAIIQKDFFSGLQAPATLTLVGPPFTTSPATTFHIDLGNSAVFTYSGDDAVSTDIIPPIGTTDDTNLRDVEDVVGAVHSADQVIGTPSNISPELPDFLSSPYALDAMIRSMATVAQSSGRYFPSGTTPPDFGNNATGQGITFCDGNVSIGSGGGGILIVTGSLEFHGGTDFKGLIIITGQAGMYRRGGGNGIVQGNVIIAPYVGSRIADGITPSLSDTFLAPQYDMNGGGNSTLVYNSSATANSLVAVSNFVLGVVEK